MFRDSIVPSAAATAAPRTTSRVDRWARSALYAALQGLPRGRLTLIEADRAESFGAASDAEPHANVRIVAPATYRRILGGGALAAAESYVAGEWDCDDLTALFRVLLRNEDAFQRLDGGFARLRAPWLWLWNRLRRNSRAGSRRNIAAHYDLGNEFYALFLDPTLTYSAAFFTSPSDSLEQAQVAKLDRICRKLRLRPEHHLLEIGTGWGALAIHAATHFGCRVTTTTISERQYQFAAARVARAGLSQQVTILKQDYRDLRGRFDRLVSIEMIEAVGRDYLDGYLAQCGALLRDDGLALIQAITIADRHAASYARNVDFIQRYVFPGSYVPPLSGILAGLARRTRLQVLDLEDLTTHYARTLALWRSNFHARLDEVRAMGFPESFVRLWHYYLCYCEAGFLERSIGDVQLLIAGPDFRGVEPWRPDDGRGPL